MGEGAGAGTEGSPLGGLSDPGRAGVVGLSVGVGAAVLGVAGGWPLLGLGTGVALGLVAGRWSRWRAPLINGGSDVGLDGLTVCMLGLAVLMVPSLMVGTASLERVGLNLGLYALALLGPGLVSWRLVPGAAVETGLTLRRLDRGVGLGLLVYAAVNLALISRAFLTLGDRFMPQDTAYFEQCVWGLATGQNFLMGSSQQWWLYNPPLTSHFAMHFSPLLLGVVPLYGLVPSFHVLHAVQVAAITLSGLPFYLYWRRWDAVTGIGWMIAYLFSATVIAQTWLSFHELSLAAPFVAFAALYFCEGRFGPYLLTLMLAMAAREDLALLVILAGMSAVLVPARRPFSRWVLLPILSGVGWWMGAGAIMRWMGASGGQVILGLFSRFGATPLEILLGMVQQPHVVVQMMLEGHRTAYVLEQFRTGGFGALGSPLSLWILPALAINLLVRGAGTAWPDVHYSLYLPPVLMMGALGVWQRVGEGLARRLRLPEVMVHRCLASWLLPLVLIGLPQVVVPRIPAWLGSPDRAEGLAMVQRIPAQASVAAPRHLVPFLAQRERLYIVNRQQAYTFYDPEYVMVDRNPEGSGLKDGTLESYRAYVTHLRTDPAFEQVMEGQFYQLFRERNHVVRPRPGLPLGLKGTP